MQHWTFFEATTVSQDGGVNCVVFFWTTATLCKITFICFINSSHKYRLYLLISETRSPCGPIGSDPTVTINSRRSWRISPWSWKNFRFTSPNRAWQFAKVLPCVVSDQYFRSLQKLTMMLENFAFESILTAVIVSYCSAKCNSPIAFR